MVRIAFATILCTAMLFGVDAWASWLMETDHQTREVVLSPWFTVLAIGGAIFVCFAAAAACYALIVSASRPSGRRASGEGE
ncbi:hypothetical protein [Novosphingobium sp. RL4]|uniref:hypothetical protein n=1 Tax=Novosphingobium sp. RL4 TaxID=3109595 RepID=UPI002D7906A5|nr:hypothetical protein [Novosphingobium sp. RL4]WRT91879.1 hypothetical protein U9J33_11720 [Novosphingobium sp. RL4]